MESLALRVFVCICLMLVVVCYSCPLVYAARGNRCNVVLCSVLSFLSGISCYAPHSLAGFCFDLESELEFLFDQSGPCFSRIIRLLLQ